MFSYRESIRKGRRGQQPKHERERTSSCHLKHHLIHFRTHQDDGQTTWLLILSFSNFCAGWAFFFE
jgi:hypothetical protein